MHKQISSLQNPLVKQLLLLQEKSRERKKTGLFAIEGVREVQLAWKGGYELTSLLFCPEIAPNETLSALKTSITSETELIEVTAEVYKKIAYRASTEGILAIAKAKSLALSELNLPKENALILVAEAPEKPGNIGALLRTADAAKLDAVIIANPLTDIYNPNILRSSVGGVFTNQIAVGSTDEVIHFLQEKGIGIYSATLQAAIHYHQCDFSQNTALVVGTEATGLSQPWRDQSTQNIIIPMQGTIDSMNVSVAAGILIFEAKRQRDFT